MCWRWSCYWKGFPFPHISKVKIGLFLVFVCTLHVYCIRCCLLSWCLSGPWQTMPLQALWMYLWGAAGPLDQAVFSWLGSFVCPYVLLRSVCDWVHVKYCLKVLMSLPSIIIKLCRIFFINSWSETNFFLDKISDANFFRPILLAPPKYQMAAP